MTAVRKAFAYITRGDELLVFRHVHVPDAGIQVPAGTVDAGETPEQAVMREAFEETGLEGLRLVRPLGEQLREVAGQLHHRYFFHLTIADAPATWRHFESTPCAGGDPIEFELYWVPLASVPPLALDHEHFVAALRAAR